MAVTLLSGGGGGAKLAHGMARVAADLTVVVNTADDAVLYGLSISPDIDTVMYTLAGLVNESKGWGLEGETFASLEAMATLGEDTWFLLGDRDLATHILRSERLRAGMPLSKVTAQFCAALGVHSRVLPMTNDRVATLLETDEGRLSFQEYFVRRAHRDKVTGYVFDGIEQSHPAPGVIEALNTSDVVVIGPSNPFVSIGPILAVPGVRDALAKTSARRVGVSPIVGGSAVKGPAATMLESLGHEVSALGVARMYADVLDVFVIDEEDAQLAPPITALGVKVVMAQTLMGGVEGRERLARDVLSAIA